MSTRIVKTPQARRDLADLATYIAKDSVDAALRFLDAAEAECARLAEMPGLGADREFRNPRLGGLRFWAIKGFEKHLIFYRRTEGGIEIVRVLHGARDIDGMLFE